MDETQLQSRLSELFVEEIKERLENKHILDLKFNKPLIKKQKYMEIGQDIYSPRLDIGVGPFRFSEDNPDYNLLLRGRKFKSFIRKISERGIYLAKGKWENFVDNEQCLEGNPNPRCLLAIEIEDKTTRKHFMGSSLNASMMGKIGIVVCKGKSEGKAKRLFGFLKEMIRRDKLPEMLMRNVIWIDQRDFEEILSTF